MVKLKDTKLTADIDDQTEEYVTFWGKIKGNIAKQEDLMDLINSAKVSLSSSIESLRTWFKKELKNLKTSDLENDGDGTQLPDGTANPFVTKDVTDALDSKIDSIEDDIMDSIYDSLVTDVTDNVTNNIADDITDIVVTAANEAVDAATKDIVDDITVTVKEDVESLIPVDVSDLVNDAGYVTLTDLDNNHYVKESDLSSVATTGSYNDLTDKPVIPAAQVNSDWNATGGVTQILNKPVIPTTTEQLVNDSGFITLSSLSGYATESYVNNHHDSTKQAVLESGVNIKTINNESILGEGNITIEGGGSGTGDYDDLENKPSINSVELSGNKTASDLGLQETIQDLAEIRSSASAGSTALQADDIEAGEGINISDSSEGKIVVSNTVDVGYSVERYAHDIAEDSVPFEATVDDPTTGYVSFAYGYKYKPSSSESSESAIYLDGITSNNIPNEITVTTYEGKSYKLLFKDESDPQGIHLVKYESSSYEQDSGHKEPYVSLIIVTTEDSSYITSLKVISDTAAETESGTYEKPVEIKYDFGNSIEVTDDFKDAVDYVTGYSLNQSSENMLLRQCHVHEEETPIEMLMNRVAEDR